MTNQSLEKWLLRGVQALMFAVPFLPLYVSKNLLFPYITGRNFAFRIIVEIAAVLWAGLMAFSSEYSPKFSKVTASVLVFTAIVFIADLFGADFYKSFWSNYERMEGFLQIAHMALFYLILTSVFRLKDWKIYANLIIIGSVIVSFFATLQKIGVLKSIQGGDRVDGTIGNPAYLAAYLLLAIFITLAALVNTEKRLLKYMYGAVIAFELAILYFTATRGAILALLAGAVLFIALFFWVTRSQESYGRMRTTFIGALILLMLVPAGIWLAKDTVFIRSSNTLSRLTSISLKDQTTQSRFLIWNIALKGVKEHPILGWGQENFNLVFNKYYDPRLWNQEPWFDRSHNIVFDWLSNAGILGLLAYLALFVAAIRTLINSHRKGSMNTSTFLVFMTALGAYFVQNLFVFDNFNSYFLFFSILAFVGSPEGTFISYGARGGKKGERDVPRDYRISHSFLAVGGAVALMLTPAFFQGKAIVAGYRFINAVDLSRSGADEKRVVEELEKALSHESFGGAEIREKFLEYAARAAQESAISDAEKIDILKKAIYQMERQAAKSPDVRYRVFLAVQGYANAATYDPSYFVKAEKTLSDVIAQFSKRQSFYAELVEVYLREKKAEDAYVFADRSWKLDQSNPNARGVLTIAAIYSQRFDVADALIWPHGEWNGLGGYEQNILGAYASVKKYDAMVLIYKKIIETGARSLDRSDPQAIQELAQYHANLAAVYKLLGRKDLARKEASSILLLDPVKFQKAVNGILQEIDR